MILKEIANYAQQFGSLLIALLGCLFFFKRDRPIKILALYGLNSFVFQVISETILYFKIKGALNLNGNIYTLSEMLILLSFFYSLYSTKSSKNIVLIFVSVYLIMYFFFLFDHWRDFIGSIRTLRDAMIVVCSLVYFYSLVKNMPATNITKYPLFWINVALLFFFAGTLMLSISVDYWIKTLGDNFAWFWIFRNFFRFLFCLVVCYGLWLDLKQVKQKLATAQ